MLPAGPSAAQEPELPGIEELLGIEPTADEPAVEDAQLDDVPADEPTADEATEDAPADAPTGEPQGLEPPATEPDEAVFEPMSVSPGGTAIRRANTFYAYVAAGENLDVSFVQWLSHPAATDVTVTVRGPAGVVESCTRLATDPVGSACEWTDLTSTESGIWQIDFTPADLNADYYTWSIDVQDGATTLDGR